MKGTPVQAPACRPFLNLTEAAQLVETPERVVMSWVAQGWLPTVRISGRPCVLTADLTNWLPIRPTCKENHDGV